MASSKSVTVLTPNGRRQIVKVSPNTTILQIIEEVCKKHGFNPEEYDVRHHKKTLDTNSTIAFSGLPNNAQLELVASTRTRSESEVIIGIHLEDGNRLLGTFQPNTTIYDILTNLVPNELDSLKNLVIIYMRREIYGLEQFQSIDLKSLGLTGGRAMLRLIHRLPEELKTQANVSVPLPSKPAEEKPYMRKLQHVDWPESIRTTPESNVEGTPRMEETKESPAVNQNDNEPTSSIKNVKKNIPNMLDMIKSEKQKQKSLKRPESTEVSRQIAEDIDHSVNDQEFLFLGERNAMLFSLETAQKVPTEELPDDFFELTIDDAKKLLRDIKRRRLELENQPLMTSNLRQLEESKKQLCQMNKYTKTIIRIQFPDRTVLQGTFSVADNVRTVMAFVRDYLENENLDFYLYTTPPKQVLEEDNRLLEIGCVPGALLHFGTNCDHQNQTFLKRELMDKFTTSSTASMAAAKLRKEAKRRENSGNEKNNDEEFSTQMDCDNDVNVGASTSTAIYVDYDKPSTSKQENVPKWFKAGK